MRKRIPPHEPGQPLLTAEEAVQEARAMMRRVADERRAERARVKALEDAVVELPKASDR